MTLPSMEIKQFMRQKEQCLSGVDLSRKGSVDSPILDLVSFINAQPDCFTTSSCSGRIIVVDNTDESGEVQKQGCQWLHVTHEEACPENVQTCLVNSKGAAVFKFEPMVMHIQVRSLQLAQHLHTTAVASGFRNSGISVGGKGKIIVAVRSTHSLEVPLSCSGQILVTDAYIEHLVHCANKKMQENINRIHRFFDNFKKMVEHQNEEPKGKQPKRGQSRCHPLSTLRQSDPVDGANPVDTSTEVSAVHSYMKDNGGIEESFESFLFDET